MSAASRYPPDTRASSSLPTIRGKGWREGVLHDQLWIYLEHSWTPHRVQQGLAVRELDTIAELIQVLTSMTSQVVRLQNDMLVEFFFRGIRMVISNEPCGVILDGGEVVQAKVFNIEGYEVELTDAMNQTWERKQDGVYLGNLARYLKLRGVIMGGGM